MAETCQHVGCARDAEFRSYHVCDPDGVFACEAHLGELLGFTCDHDPGDTRHSLAFHVYRIPGSE